MNAWIFQRLKGKSGAIWTMKGIGILSFNIFPCLQTFVPVSL